jgi:hypothetical protein
MKWQDEQNDAAWSVGLPAPSYLINDQVNLYELEMALAGFYF